MAHVSFFDPEKHRLGTVSRKGVCAAGGEDTCHEKAVASVVSDHGLCAIASCPKHLWGAVQWVGGQETARPHGKELTAPGHFHG